MGKTKKSQQKAKSKQTLITEQSHDRMNYLSQLSLCAAVGTSNPQMQSLSAFYAQSAFKTSLRTQSKVYDLILINLNLNLFVIIYLQNSIIQKNLLPEMQLYTGTWSELYIAISSACQREIYAPMQ
ncbi:hypothetical protein MP228_010521 [Amoeboaphelidium protococcarum]|nr:hypothetical protein MP228_010521 [Amoeboaphelidium protococcarum]